MNDKLSSPHPLSPVAELRGEAARQLGCEVVALDAETGYLFELRRGGLVRVLVGGISPLNDASAARLAEDKFHTGLLLERAGFRVPATARCLRQGRFHQEDFAAHSGTATGLRFAQEHGFPLIVKPNRGACGRDVVRVDEPAELLAAVACVWQHDYLALVQKPVAGIDVRLDFLDGDYLFGYVRRTVVVEGDGRSTLRELVAACDLRFTGESFWRRLVSDPLWLGVVAPRRLGLDSVLGAGERLDFSSFVVNLNRLATAERLCDPPAEWLEHGRRVGATLGLRHFGVDYKVADLADGPAAATVLEVNASPSLAQMARLGHRDEALAAEMRVVAAILG